MLRLRSAARLLRVPRAAQLRWCTQGSEGQQGLSQQPEQPPGFAEFETKARKELEEVRAENVRSIKLCAKLYTMGQVLVQKNEVPEAMKLFSEGLELQAELQPGSDSLAKSLFMVGHILYACRDYDMALEFFQKSIDLKEKNFDTTDKSELAKVYYLAGQLQLAQKKLDEAGETLDKMFKVSESEALSAEEKPMLAQMFCVVASGFHRHGAFDRALGYYTRARPILEELRPEQEELAMLYCSLAAVHSQKAAGIEDQVKRAVEVEASNELCMRAVDVLEKMKEGSPQGLYYAYGNLEQLFREMGNTEYAEKCKKRHQFAEKLMQEKTEEALKAAPEKPEA